MRAVKEAGAWCVQPLTLLAAAALDGRQGAGAIAMASDAMGGGDAGEDPPPPLAALSAPRMPLKPANFGPSAAPAAGMAVKPPPPPPAAAAAARPRSGRKPARYQQQQKQSPENAVMSAAAGAAAAGGPSHQNLQAAADAATSLLTGRLRPLVMKKLTSSDVSSAVSRHGRIILPRVQIEEHFADILRLGGADTKGVRDQARWMEDLCVGGCIELVSQVVIAVLIELPYCGPPLFPTDWHPPAKGRA